MDKKITLISFLDLDPEHIEPMSEEDSMVFLSLAMTDQPNPTFHEFMDNTGLIEEIPKEVTQHLSVRILESRTKGLVDFSTNCGMWIATICDTPGDAVMWAYTLACLKANRVDADPIMEDVITIRALGEIFPYGFPTKKGREIVWEQQKGYTHGVNTVDNFLDRKEIWEVFR